MTRVALFMLGCCLLLACSSQLPPRYVLERDLDGFIYRRYQKTLDVEVAIDRNPATGHTASYLRRGHGKKVFVATAFVTVYAHAASLSAEVHDRLSELQRYRLGVEKLGGGYVLTLDGGPSERWALWVSGRYLVKLGAPAGESVPEALADAYMDLYPSDFDEHGRAREDAESRGQSQRQQKQKAEEERELPKYLRENAPR